jgi:hypothetical protein
MRHKAFLVLLGMAVVTQPAWGEVARIKRAQGAASVQRGKTQMNAAPGFVLLPGDMLVTGKDGQMSLTFIDDTRFSVGPNSRISVDKFDYDRRNRTGNFEVNVSRGALAVVSGQIAHSKLDAMKVRTPTSVLGVRGTRFIVDVPR